jgi:hypothetical protein
MALWKPFRGNRTSLDAVEKHDGYIYFCIDDGSLFFDYIDADGNLQRKQVSAYGAGAKPQSATVTLLADNWMGDTNPWSQIVTINGVTTSSKIDLQPTATQIVALQNEEIALMAENNTGTITVYAIGNKPTEDYTMQALITEVAPI